MADKCFCHFCGYEVKDAAARAAIEKLETSTNEALQEQKNEVDQQLQAMEKKTGSIDISDKVVIEGAPGGNVTEVTIDSKKYIYNPALGAVFFSIKFSFTGTMEKDVNGFAIIHLSGYMGSKNQPGRIACSVTPGNLNAFYSFASDGEVLTFDSICITAAEDITTTSHVGYVSGWYFCDGEPAAEEV